MPKRFLRLSAAMVAFTAMGVELVAIQSSSPMQCSVTM